MLLQRCTWPEVDEYLGRSRGIIVPLGSTEQHGPNGLIGTDALCAEAVAREAGEIADALVGPTIAYGVAPFNLGFPGTVSLRARTFSALLLDCLLSLQRHGFEHVYCLNGHGGNQAPAMSAFSDLYAEASLRGDAPAPPKCRLVSWWSYERTNALRTQLYGAREGLHATPSEVAITQHLQPQSAKPTTLPALEALDVRGIRALAGDAHYDAARHRHRYPDGRVGSAPDLATPEAGARLLSLAAEEAAADYLDFLREDHTS